MNETSLPAQLAHRDLDRLRRYQVYLEGIAVARNLPAAEMALGRKVAVVFFNESNAKEAVVVGVYT